MIKPIYTWEQHILFKGLILKMFDRGRRGGTEDSVELEDRGERVEREVDIYQSVDDIVSASQDRAGRQTQGELDQVENSCHDDFPVYIFKHRYYTKARHNISFRKGLFRFQPEIKLNKGIPLYHSFEALLENVVQF